MNVLVFAAALKVLTIGNSFSVQMVSAMPPIAQDMGLELDICSLYIGGCTLERHWKNVCNPTNKPYSVTRNTFGKSVKGFKGNIPDMLKADKWDVVTIQQGSHESWRKESYHPYGDQLVAKIRELAPQAKIYVQQTWSYTPWDKRLAKWGINQDTMFGALEAAYADFAQRHGLEQIYTGEAVQRYRKALPVVYTEKTNDDDVCGTSVFEEKDGRWTPKGDVFHFNARGHFLQGLVWTARLFNVDVTKSTYVPKCLAQQPERAALMRKIATELK